MVITRSRVLAEEKDKQHFIEDVMSKLKHETFPVGYPLATIGVCSCRMLDGIVYNTQFIQEIGHHMFFLAKGTVKGKTKTRSFEMGSGSSFGEIALMCPMSKRTANITTVTPCEIFLMSREGFDELRAGYPALGSGSFCPRRYALTFLQVD